MTETKYEGIDAIVLTELPLKEKPFVGDYIQMEGTKLIINPQGTPCDEITDAATARCYAYAAARLVAGWYHSLAPRRHTFSPPTGPLTLNKGVWKAEDGKWYFLDSKDGRYIQTNREVRIDRRELAHEFNDELCTYRIVADLGNKDGEWRNWAESLVEVMNAPDRPTANRLLNERIARSIERAKVRKAVGRAVANGEAKEIKVLTLDSGIDLMAFTSGKVLDKTTGKTHAWSAQSEWAIMTVANLKEAGHELEFQPPVAVR